MRVLKPLLVIIPLSFYTCSTEVSYNNVDQSSESIIDTSQFTSDKTYTLKSTSDLSKYFFQVVSYNKNGATFKILHKEDQKDFINHIIGHRGFDNTYSSQPTAKEILDSIQVISKNKRFLIEVTETAEAISTMYSISTAIPKTGKEYVDGIEWINTSPGYFSKIFQKRNTMWWNWYDIYYDFSPKLADWEKELITKYNIDSLGLSIPHSRANSEVPELADASTYDTTYYSRLFPNRKIPYKSSWNSTTFEYLSNWSVEDGYFRDGRGEYNSGMILLRNYVSGQRDEVSYQEFYDGFISFLLNADYTPLEWISSSYECNNALFASPFSVSFSSKELKQIDEVYGTDYWGYYSFMKEKSKGPSPACQCAQVLASPSGYPRDLRIRCLRMYKSWNNANADCLMGTETVW